MKTLYETQATAIGGRVGSAASSDGRLRVRLDLPATLGGDDRQGTNPEQLFAAGYAAAFLSAIRRAAGREGRILAADSNVTASIALSGDAVDEDCQLSVSLTVDLPGLDAGDARRIVSAAHAACPYASAARGNLGIRITID